MSKRTFTIETDCWLMPYSGLDELTAEHAASALSFYPFSDAPEGYCKVGRAAITITVGDEKEIIASKVESMRAEQKKVIANAQMKSTQIERKIQELLAITYEQVE